MKKVSILTLFIILGLGLSNLTYAINSRDAEALKRYRDYVASPTQGYNCNDIYNNALKNYDPQIFVPQQYNNYNNYNNSNYYNNSVYYNNQPYYQQPIQSEFYKNVTNINNGVIINITSDNYSIVSRIQSSIRQSITNEFVRQPVNINTNNLYNGAQITITVNNLYNGYYNVWDSNYNIYRSMDSYSFIKSIQNFAYYSMPVIRYDGYVTGWN
ncbi:MAG: hypothetical protein PHZ26_00315 [Candidatus Gracilibacteria bacterium]|nr:hypothetical protein [Candidatus Gracilibacteria bacterium]MDD2908180.1 hypothetical protein [Candidatus Gracilibacteria bacterium]